MERDPHGHIVRPFTNERKLAVLEFRDAGQFARAGQVGRSNWRRELYNFLINHKGDIEVTHFNLASWIRPHYEAIDAGDWTWCSPNLMDDFIDYFDELEIAPRPQNDDVVMAHRNVPLPDVVDRLILQMWSAVFEKLLDPFDVINTAKAHPVFAEILHSQRNTWLLQFVMPYIAQYLTREDVLQCRLVCQRWLFAVEHFLENNAMQRPTFEDETTKAFTGIKLHRTDTSDNLMHNKYLPALPLGISIMSDKAVNLFNEPGIFNGERRCPIVGKTGRIMEDGNADAQHLPSTLDFLHALGKHFTAMSINLENLTPLECLSRSITLLANTSNLRTLSIYMEDLQIGNTSPPQLQQQLTDFWILEVSQQTKLKLPQVESFSIHIVDEIEEEEIIMEAFLRALVTGKLEFLHTSTLPLGLPLDNLASIEIYVSSDDEIESLRLLNSPLRKLSLIYFPSTNLPAMFQAIARFGQTLTNMEFCISLDPEQEQEANMLPFFLPTTLQAATKMITFSNENILPPSLNFLVGLNGSLRYMHFFVNDDNAWPVFRNRNVRRIFPQEILDLLENLKNAIATARLNLYKSNVWAVFPKLMVIQVELEKAVYVPAPLFAAAGVVVGQQQGNHAGREKEKHFWEFRRDVYEKVQSARH